MEGSKEKSEAESYLNKLLNDGAKEGIDFTTPLQTPPYYNDELYKKAQKYYLSYLLLIVGSHLSGLISVLSIPSIHAVLAATKESETIEKSYRRYVGTIYHVVLWMLYPLKQGSLAWNSLDIVRKVHSRASKSCENSINTKINQKDLVLTQYAFVAFFDADWHIPKKDTKDFYEAWFHYWRTIGYILGIKEEYNLCTDSLVTTKERIAAIKEKVYKPALENAGEDFQKFAEILVNGLWFHSPDMSADSVIFLTKWAVGCDGYQYFESDFKNGATKDNTKLAYKELSWYQRFLISFSFFVSRVLYQFTIMRWYFNFRVLLSLILSYYIPALAIFKFGFKGAYVRIFPKKSDTKKAN